MKMVELQKEIDKIEFTPEIIESIKMMSEVFDAGAKCGFRLGVLSVGIGASVIGGVIFLVKQNKLKKAQEKPEQNQCSE